MCYPDVPHGVLAGGRLVDSLVMPSEPRAPAFGRIGAWAGLIGSVTFVAVFTIEGLLRPGYDPASMYISALSLGPRGWIQIANFMVAGALIVLFARGIAARFGGSLGTTFITLIGIGLFASGPFVMDPVGTSFFQMSGHSKLHYLFGAVVFSLAPASCFVFFWYLGRAPGWRMFRWWTLALGLVMVVGIFFLKAAALPPSSNSLHPWLGAIQRATLIPFFLWVFTFALTLVRPQERSE
jgi:hypothetical protein